MNIGEGWKVQYSGPITVDTSPVNLPLKEPWMLEDADTIVCLLSTKVQFYITTVSIVQF